MKKILCSILCVCAFLISSCGGKDKNEPDGKSGVTEVEQEKWFTSETLEAMGLKDLKAPDIKDGKINVSMGYQNIFSQEASQEQFDTYVDYVFDYFNTNYSDLLFGKNNLYSSNITNNTFVYTIIKPTDKSDCFNDNPSPRYEIYYTTDLKLQENGYFHPDKVFYLDVRYEESKIKVIVRLAISSIKDGTTKSYFLNKKS